MKLSLIIQSIDRASAPMRKIAAASHILGGNLKKATAEGGLAGRMLDRVGAAAGRGMSGIARLTTSVAQLAGRGGLWALRKSASLATDAIRGTISIAARLAAGTFAAGIAGAGLFAHSILGIASEFEQFQVILENTEGSAAKARKAMSWVKQFAKTTPYEVGEVMEAFVQLKAYGIDPMGGALVSLGNAASGMNKRVMQAVEMLADANTGEFERLKEFGIKASAVGSKVKYTYQNAGKEITKTSTKNAAAIQKAILGIFDQRFKGMMDRQSRTLKGLWSNIMDMFSNFELDIADAGIFDFIKGKIQTLLDKINALSANGTLQRWAEGISKWLEKAGTKVAAFIEETDWNQAGRDLKDAAEGVWTVVRGIAALVRGLGALRAKLDQWGHHDLFGNQVQSDWERLTDRGRPKLPDRPVLPRVPGMNKNFGMRAPASSSILTVKVEAAPGLRATVSDAKPAPGTSLLVKRGRSMAPAQ